MVEAKATAIGTLDERTLRIEYYENRDHVVVSHFRNVGQDDISLELDRCIGLGVRVMQIASPVVSLEEIHAQFGEMTAMQRAHLEDAKTELRKEMESTLNPLLGSGGSLHGNLKQTQNFIEQELKKYLDPESAKSVAASVGKQVDESLRATERRVSEAVRQAMDITDEASGVAKVFKAIQAQKNEQAEQFTKLMERVSNAAGHRAERTTSTRKGADYEEASFEEVRRIGSVHGDAVALTATSFGDTGRRRGDFTVTLDDRVTSGRTARIAIEAMDRDHSKLSLKAVLKELGEAKENRAANAAVALVSSAEVPAAGGCAFQRHPGNLYVCVLDKETWDTLPLEVAYSAARIDALATVGASPVGEIDLARAAELIDEAVGFLSLIQRAKARLGTSRNGLTETEGILGELEGKLTGCLAKLSAMLDADG